MVDGVLFDRDGTLVVDVPYNGDPDLVEPVPGALDALRRLRDAGVALGIVSNQSGVARGLLTAAQVRAVNRRVVELLGRFGRWRGAPTGRRPAAAAASPLPAWWWRPPAGWAWNPSGARWWATSGPTSTRPGPPGRAVLVPNRRTLPTEVVAAERAGGVAVAPDLGAAVDVLLGRP